MPFKITDNGKLQETGAKEILLAFNRENLITLLNDIIAGGTQHSHQDMVYWVRGFYKYYNELFENGEDIDFNLDKVLVDMDGQWIMWLFNSYSVDQLLELDLSKVKLPKELLIDWQHRLETR